MSRLVKNAEKVSETIAWLISGAIFLGAISLFVVVKSCSPAVTSAVEDEKKAAVSYVLEPSSRAPEWNRLELQQKRTLVRQISGLSNAWQIDQIVSSINTYWDPFGPEEGFNLGEKIFETVRRFAASESLRKQYAGKTVLNAADHDRWLMLPRGSTGVEWMTLDSDRKRIAVQQATETTEYFSILGIVSRLDEFYSETGPNKGKNLDADFYESARKFALKEESYQIESPTISNTNETNYNAYRVHYRTMLSSAKNAIELAKILDKIEQSKLSTTQDDALNQAIRDLGWEP